jgi:hypothetical protein
MRVVTVEADQRGPARTDGVPLIRCSLVFTLDGISSAGVDTSGAGMTKQGFRELEA